MTRAYLDPSMPGPAEVPLCALDQTTVRALCDAGYVDAAAYTELAEAHGWCRPAQVVAPPMAQQAARPRPITKVA